MCLCDSCGDYHPVEDCEVVVVKMIIGKGCDIKQKRQTKAVFGTRMSGVIDTEDTSKVREVVEDRPVEEKPEKIKMAITVNKPLKDLTPTEKALEDIYNPNHSDLPIKLDPKRTSIIPPHLRGLMKPEDIIS